MRIQTDMSGYAYKEWKGSFYPADLPAEAMLRHYATRFGTVRINNTFYRLPRESVLLDWGAGPGGLPLLHQGVAPDHP